MANLHSGFVVPINALALRDTNEAFGTTVVPHGAKNLAVTCVNGLNQNVSLKVYGAFDPAGTTYGNYLWTTAATVTSGGGVNWINVPLPNAFPYIRVSVTAGSSPTTGTVTVRCNSA